MAEVTQGVQEQMQYFLGMHIESDLLNVKTYF
jgi:hypothetical protein